MSKIYTNNYSFLNLYKKPQTKSEIVTQIIFGESFKILQTSKKWLKIKIKEDGYVGFIKKIKIFNYIKPNFKVSALYANVYRNSKNKKIISKLPFSAKIKVEKNPVISNRFHGGKKSRKRRSQKKKRKSQKSKKLRNQNKSKKRRSQKKKQRKTHRKRK